jgi:hypothetical protein
LGSSENVKISATILWFLWYFLLVNDPVPMMNRNFLSPAVVASKFRSLFSARISAPFAVTALFVAATWSAAPVYAGLNFQFDYTYDDNGFFGSSGSVQRGALESAASYLEGILGDDFDAIVPDVRAGNTWVAGIFDPENRAVGIKINNLVVPADTLIVYVGGSDLSGIGALGFSKPGDISASGSAAFVNGVVNRGEGGIITPWDGTGATLKDDTDVAPWGGVISFDNLTNWNFDDESGSGASTGEFDFRTVALHELSHVLGFGSVDSFDRLVSGSDFTGPNAVAAYGGHVPLTSDLHFDGVSSTVFQGGAAQSAVLNGSLPTATRREFTAVDAAALDDIGYDVVPEPTSPLLLLTASAAWLLRRPRRHYANANANAA